MGLQTSAMFGGSSGVASITRTSRTTCVGKPSAHDVMFRTTASDRPDQRATFTSAFAKYYGIDLPDNAPWRTVAVTDGATE